MTFKEFNLSLRKGWAPGIPGVRCSFSQNPPFTPRFPVFILDPSFHIPGTALPFFSPSPPIRIKMVAVFIIFAASIETRCVRINVQDVQVSLIGRTPVLCIFIQNIQIPNTRTRIDTDTGVLLLFCEKKK